MFVAETVSCQLSTTEKSSCYLPSEASSVGSGSQSLDSLSNEQHYSIVSGMKKSLNTCFVLQLTLIIHRSTQRFIMLILILLLYFSYINGQVIPPILSTTTTTTQRPTPASTQGREKPNDSTYQKDSYLMQWLFNGCWSEKPGGCPIQESNKSYEYEGYDGFYNNVGRPELGSVDTPLLRRAPAAYKDGSYQPSGFDRPQPLTLSEKLLNGDVGTRSQTGKNAFLVFFGQQVVEEILDAQRAACPPEYFNIDIPEWHKRYREIHSELPVLRTRYDARTGFSPNNPRQQLNEITPYIDGGLVYGTTKAWSDVLRTYKNGTIDPHGKLASSNNGLFPEVNKIRLPMANPPPPFHHDIYSERHELEKVERFFMLGNPRGNENPYLLTFGVLWFRWHNHVAENIYKLHRDWSSEKIFNEARRWVIATQQHIITNEWLNEWLGDELPEYSGYDPSVDPQIDQFFQGAAFRFGHTLVPPAVQTRDYLRNGCTLTTIVRTCNSFWRPQELLREIGGNDSEKMDLGMDRLIMGMAGQLSEKEDHKIVEDLRGNVFGPLEFSRRDLMAINIQRARDHGLPDYNTVRKIFKLPPVDHDLTHFYKVDQKIKDEFKSLHANRVDNIDLWVGGLMETDKGPGPLFREIIKDQFRRIRDGDRFWYNNTNNGLFTVEEIQRIKSLKFRDILLSVTKLLPEDIQQNPFRVPLNGHDNGLKANCSKVFEEVTCSEINSTMTITCWHTSANLDKVKEISCSPPKKYDYFSTSQISFILTFLGLGALIIGLIFTLGIMMRVRQKKSLEKSEKFSYKMRDSMKKKDHEKDVIETHTASEWIGRNKPERPVLIMLSIKTKKIQIVSQLGQLIRALDMTHRPLTKVFVTTDKNYLMIRVEHNYDLVLKFPSEYLREKFLKIFEEFGAAINMNRENITTFNTAAMLKHAVTKKQRQEKLDKFFRVVFAQGFGIEHNREEILKTDARVAKDVIYTELTITEFAEALSMSAEAEFVKKMFALVDKDKNGFISFREFVDLSVIFFKGTPEQTIRLMFDMYDINATGSLSREEFSAMLRSFMETVNADLKSDDLNVAITEMMNAAGIANKQAIDFEDFQRLLGDYKQKLSLEFNLPGSPTTKQTFASKAQRVVDSLYGDPREIQSRIQGQNDAKPKVNIDKKADILVTGRKMKNYWYPFTKYIADKQLEIFWLFLYTSVLISIFAERAYYYHVEREHSGLRRIAGPGVTLTRGAASAMMFTYSTLLVTMCQNTITTLRETFLYFYIPFDSSLEMHKYVACWALVFTIMHVLGHAINFYHIATQPSDDLTCLFPNFFHGTHEIPKFGYWCWQTITGITGIALTVLAAVMFLFSVPIVRRRLYKWFWVAHSMYPIFFILMILHGTGRLIQQPFTHLFLAGPVILFTLDKIITATRRTVEIQVLKANCLPSGVTYLEFRKPSDFQYKSGQWVRISCPDLNRNEYHPFTLSSSPNEPNLTVHIRAVGPWTSDIRNRIDPTLSTDTSLPKIIVDGPYGEGAQDWYKYDVGILVGGGIGVTPFASILKDIVYKSNVNQSLGCKKIYFLWVTRTQRQFEWMVDILRELEAADEKMCVSAHIFITQFYQKFDLRTVLLYICERYFQRVSNKSLFTGLTAVTHFGRPNFLQFFRGIRDLNTDTSRIGVFSCGARSMVSTVDQACHALNQETTSETLFKHQYKSF